MREDMFVRAERWTRLNNMRTFDLEYEHAGWSSYQAAVASVVLGFGVPVLMAKVQPWHGEWNRELANVSAGINEAMQDVYRRNAEQSFGAFVRRVDPDDTPDDDGSRVH
jgi:hypothetical protein